MFNKEADQGLELHPQTQKDPQKHCRCRKSLQKAPKLKKILFRQKLFTLIEAAAHDLQNRGMYGAFRYGDFIVKNSKILSINMNLKPNSVEHNFRDRGFEKVRRLKPEEWAGLPDPKGWWMIRDKQIKTETIFEERNEETRFPFASDSENPEIENENQKEKEKEKEKEIPLEEDLTHLFELDNFENGLEWDEYFNEADMFLFDS